MKQSDNPERLQTLFERFILTLRLLIDRRVDRGYKLLPLLAVLYVLSPIDLMPEALLGPFGLLDDIGILLLGLEAFIRLTPTEIVQEHLRALHGRSEKRKNDEDIIEGEYIVRE